MCKDSVRAYNISRDVCSKSPIYKSDRIKNITADSDNYLYILEEENAEG